MKLLSESLRRRKFIIWPPSGERAGRRREAKGAERRAGWRVSRFARRLAGCRRRREQERCRCYVREPPRLLLIPPLPRLSRPPVSRWQPPKPLPPCLAFLALLYSEGARAEGSGAKPRPYRPPRNRRGGGGGSSEKPAVSRRHPSQRESFRASGILPARKNSPVFPPCAFSLEMPGAARSPGARVNRAKEGSCHGNARSSWYLWPGTVTQRQLHAGPQRSKFFFHV